MPDDKLHIGGDAWVDGTHQAQNHSDEERFTINGSASPNDKRAYLFLGGPPFKDGRVISATLRLWVQKAWDTGGPATLKASRITAPWKERSVNYNNKPAVTASNAATLSVANGTSQGTMVELDVTAMLQDVLAGAKWYGIELTQSAGTNKDRYIYTADANDPDKRPELEVVWSRKPEGPQDLAPSGGREVNTGTPTLSWKFRDRDGDDQMQYQVQVDNASDMSSPNYDSGWQASSQQELSLAGLITLGASTTWYWRVRTQDTNGDISDWSDIESFVRTDKGVLTMSSPGALVEETTPPITTTLTTHAQAAIEYILQLADSDEKSGWREIWKSRRHDAKAAAGVAYTEHLPKGLLKHENRNYKLKVRAWDQRSRQATPGDAAYYRAEQVFAFNDSAVPAAVSTLTVTQEADGGPGLVLLWTRSPQPDYFAVRAVDSSGNSEFIEDRLNPADVATGVANQYTWTWYGAQPGETYDITVIAVVNDAGKLKHSRGNPTVSKSSQQLGIWLIDRDTKSAVRLLDQQEAGSFGIGESAETYFPVGRRDPVRIRDSVRGYEGNVQGLIMAVDGPQYRGRMEKWAGQGASVRLRLLLADLNIPVVIGAPELGPTPAPGKPVWHCAFDFWQIDDFTFKAK